MNTDKPIDIFVSYAHVDNKPMPGVDVGWVTELVRGLKIQLASRLGRPDAFELWMDYELRGNQSVTPAITDRLNGSKTLLLILSKGYLASDWCRQEMDGFLARVATGSGRVFVVEPDAIDVPDALEDLLGYRFWEQDPEGRITRLGYPSPDPGQTAYYGRVGDLGRDLAEVLARIVADTPDPPGAGGATKTAEAEPEPQFAHTVFLAETGDALRKQRDALRRFLEDEHIRVLPAGRYPPPPKMEAAIDQDLAQSELFVQMLGAEPDGWAGYFLQRAEAAGRAIIQWHDGQLDPETVQDPQQKALLQGERVIAADMIELQNAIRRCLAPPQPAPQPPAGDDLFVFLNHAPEESPQHIQALTDYLDSRQIGYSTPMSPEQADSAAVFRKDLEDNLLSCDALLLVYFDAPQSWVREQLMFYRRTGVRRELPMRGVGVCRKPDAPLGVKLPRLQLIACRGGDAAGCIDRFLAGVSAAAGPGDAG